MNKICSKVVTNTGVLLYLDLHLLVTIDRFIKLGKLGILVALCNPTRIAYQRETLSFLETKGSPMGISDICMNQQLEAQCTNFNQQNNKLVT